MAYWDTVLNSADASLQYGKRLIPSIIDENARSQPDRACFAISRSEALQDGFRDVNWRTYANAINKTAHFIHNEIGRSASFETVMFLGYPDLRTFIVVMALIKTGHKTLFSSYHNSLAAHTELIRQTDCTILLHTAGFPVCAILEANHMQSICLPELDQMLVDSPCQPYPYTKSWDKAKHDPCFIVHTSGESGMPKPLMWTHWMLSTVDSHHLVPALDGRPTIWASVLDTRNRDFCGKPMYNGAGLGAGLMDTAFNNTTIVIGPPRPVTAEIFEGMLKHADIDAASCLPSTLEDVARKPHILAKLKRLRFVTCIGGTLSQDAGDMISQYTVLHTLTGSSEANIVVQHSTDREDWPYICINPTCNGIQMRPVASLYELVYVRDPQHIDFQGIFKLYPNLLEFSTQDLYSRHPTKPHHWRHEGRKDDLILFRNGWKFCPMVHERLIESHSMVQYAIVVGNGKEKPAVIVQLHAQYYTENASEQAATLDHIWPYIARANNVVETYSQLERRYVIFAKAVKPFVILERGGVDRKATMELYAKETEELYANVAGGGMRGLFRTES
ncbi:hypothetical protein ACN47E_004392 [Coniothyrium glycines]